MTCSKNLRISAFLFVLLFNYADVNSQVPDSIYRSNIKTVRLHNYGDQFSMPVLNLNSSDQVELHFDDLDPSVKYYYYTFQLCNIDWRPVNLSPFDYLKGFTQMRINNYRFSSIALTKYVHYQAQIPDRSCMPSRSGNFLLKVYLDGDTSKLVFTKRLLIIESKTTIAAQVVQPFAAQNFRAYQKVQFNVNIKGLNAFSATQDIKVVVLQNYRWDNAATNIAPTFIRNNTLEYNTEDKTVFPGGKEWRWLDLRDLRLQSDRVVSADYKKSSTDVFLRSDHERTGEKYVYYRDLDGMYSIESMRGLNPYWMNDYATVHFTFQPPNGAYPDKDIYLFGQLTNYNYSDSLKMVFNADKGVYETHLLLKEGYYSYTYMAAEKRNFANRYELDGSYFEAENIYTILVYYNAFAGRAVELIGAATVTSRNDKPLFGY